MPSNGKIAVSNAELAALQVALRECGSTKVPMKLALRIVEVQRQIKSRMSDISELNNGLVAEHGVPKEDEDVATQVSSDMPGWTSYLTAFNELMAAEMLFDEPFMLYEKEDSYGWTPDADGAVELTANTIFDMGDLLEVEKKK